MELTAEIFQQIVSGLRSDERNSAKHGNRKEGRVGVRYWVDLAPPVGSGVRLNATKVMVRDLSPSGIGFACRDKLNVGLDMVCCLPNLAGSITEVPLRIQHCTQVAKNLYIIGARFIPSPPPDGAVPGQTDEGHPGKTSLSQLLYISDAKAPMSPVDLDSLMANSKRKNIANDLTGLLLYSAGHFIQLLEGDWQVVARLLCTGSQASLMPRLFPRALPSGPVQPCFARRFFPGCGFDGC